MALCTCRGSGVDVQLFILASNIREHQMWIVKTQVSIFGWLLLLEVYPFLLRAGLTGKELVTLQIAVSGKIFCFLFFNKNKHKYFFLLLQAFRKVQ